MSRAATHGKAESGVQQPDDANGEARAAVLLSLPHVNAPTRRVRAGVRGRLSLDDLTAEGGALQDAVDGLRRLEGIAPTLAPAALRKLAEGLEQLEAAVRAENASE